MSRAAHSSVTESASMCAIAWFWMIGAPNCTRSLANPPAPRPPPHEPFARAAAAGGDHQALVAEPLVGEPEAVPLPPDQVRDLDAGVFERHDRGRVGVRV